jgi:hypothetical protein
MVTPRRSGAEGAVAPADAALAQRVEGEVERMRWVLAQLIEFSGKSRREVERRLLQRGCGTDLGRLLSGRLDLKMSHVLALCRVIELEPLELVQIALKPRPGERSPLLRRLEALLPYVRAEAGPPAPAASAPEVAALLQRAQDLAEQLNDFMGEAARIAASEGAQRPAPSHGRLPTATSARPSPSEHPGEGKPEGGRGGPPPRPGP